MSAETYSALADAISAHIIDECDAEVDLIRDWVLVAAPVSLDGDSEGLTHLVIHRSPHTALYTVTGLLEWGKEAYSEVEF